MPAEPLLDNELQRGVEVAPLEAGKPRVVGVQGDGTGVYPITTLGCAVLLAAGVWGGAGRACAAALLGSQLDLRDGPAHDTLDTHPNSALPNNTVDPKRGTA